MVLGGIILASTLIAFAIWLHYNELRGWAHEGDTSFFDMDYLRSRSRGRLLVHSLLGACGALILIATGFGPGIVWSVCWLLVCLSLTCVVMLALVDAWRTQRFHARKLPELRRQLLGDDEA
jgi:hypothetical protein